MLKRLYSLIVYSILKSKNTSYSLSLFNNIELLRRKIIEESYELVSESLKSNLVKKRVIEESCDLIYHIIVYLISSCVSYCDLVRELKKRENKVNV
ncbi:phosphoribosyl-ATP diphosphatase [Candidatus Vidania fulgoroideorum]